MPPWPRPCTTTEHRASETDRAFADFLATIDASEAPLEAARREFREETGHPLPAGPLHHLGLIRRAGGKSVEAWAVAADFDPGTLQPGTFELEWPPRSGRHQLFPEIDRVAWTSPAEARRKLVKAQAAFVDRLEERHD